MLSAQLRECIFKFAQRLCSKYEHGNLYFSLSESIYRGEGVADDDIGDVGYVTDPLSFEDFTFGQKVPPVKMHKLHMKHIPASIALLQAKQPGQPHHNLSEPCGRFMKNHHAGTSEDGLHGQDDELLTVCCFCSTPVFAVGF